MNVQKNFERFAQRKEKIVSGRILFIKVAGSYGYNLPVHSSDMDYLAVYQAPTRKILSLKKPEETIVFKSPDYQIHEVEKFCNLLLKGNPTVVEMLFTERLMKESAAWQELKKERYRFLTRAVVRACLGFGQDQLWKARSSAPHGTNYKDKWVYHMMRSLLDAKRIARGDAPVVWKEDPDRKYLLAIRNREVEWEKILEDAEAAIKIIESQKPWPKVRELPDEDFLDDWLVKLRKQFR